MKPEDPDDLSEKQKQIRENIFDACYGTERGAIYNEQAYAMGKMLDHSAWQRLGILPRNITPSDIDIAFDNFGRIIFCELSTSAIQWKELKNGQLLLYQNAIRNSAHCAVLLRHNVNPGEGRLIDSHADIISFQIMLHDFGFIYSDVFTGAQWPGFVRKWFKGVDGPVLIRHRLISRSLPPLEGP